MVVEEGNTIPFCNGSQYFDGTVKVSEYTVDGEPERCFFFGMHDDVPQMTFALERSVEGACVVYACEAYSTVRYELESEEEAILQEALVGRWTSIRKYVDSSHTTNTYSGCTMTFRDDHSFTATKDGAVLEGTWTDPDYSETDEYRICNYRIQYQEDGRRNSHFIQILIRSDGGTDFSIHFDNEYAIYFEAE